jgi:AmmeMemoRadiSam system protein A
MPHPPIIIPEIGRGEEKKIKETINSMDKIGKIIQSIEPDTIILITPHGNLFRDAVVLHYDKYMKGDFSSFGYSEITMEMENDLDLVDMILTKSKKNNLPALKLDMELKKDYMLDSRIDHGAMVPMYFIKKNWDEFKFVHITYGLLKNTELYSFGRLIQESVNELGRKAVVIASGDLSHKLTKEAPSGYAKEGKEFDEKIIDSIRRNKRIELMKLDLKLSEKAGECGLRSIQVMIGVLDGLETENEILSYEGPFGVGYGCAVLSVKEKSEKMKIYNDIEYANSSFLREIRENEDELVRLARVTLETYVEKGDKLSLNEYIVQKDFANIRAGVFVSIKKNGELRGCIGTIEPMMDNIAEEIINNAINAGIYDPRFNPVKKDELDELVYSVDVLMKPEKINSKDMLDPFEYGVIVTSGGKKGVLLPNLEGIDNVDEQLRIVLKKAGINYWEKYEMERFRVIRHY